MCVNVYLNDFKFFKIVGLFHEVTNFQWMGLDITTEIIWGWKLRMY